MSLTSLMIPKMKRHEINFHKTLFFDLQFSQYPKNSYILLMIWSFNSCVEEYL